MIKKIFLVCFLFLSANVFGQSVNQTYIDNHQEKAVALMNEYHVPASIILAVAMHESASGTSKIARYLNNHFGIKGPNNSTKIRSAYRGFEEVEDSYDYFIDLLQNKSKFRILFDKYTHYDYKNWARGIQRGGYAASRTWASQVIATIKKYDLQQYDNRPDGFIETIEPVTVYKVYRVKKGDTLGAIARKYRTTVKTIMRKNSLKTTILRIGQKLKISR